MIIAGLMSGTSLDGLSIGIIEITRKDDLREEIRNSKFLLGETYPFPIALSEMLHTLAENKSVTSRIVAEAHKSYGEFCANSMKDLLSSQKLSPDLIGFHGQTIYHDPSTVGSTTTLQLGDPSPLCYEFNVPVVSDFRSMDTASGGQGAPLVPIVDYLRYGSDELGRIVLNIGGIANITFLSAGCAKNKIVSFDVGPGNMVIDAAAEKLCGVRYDTDGQIAAKGKVSRDLLNFIQEIDNFRTIKYPKSTGRERYGASFTEKILDYGKDLAKEEIIATVTYYTVFMIEYHIRMVLENEKQVDELIVGGGGAKNKHLMKLLAESNIARKISFHNDYGVPSNYWESFSFGVLAYLNLLKYPGNVPSATGAKREVVLGRMNSPYQASSSTTLL